MVEGGKEDLGEKRNEDLEEEEDVVQKEDEKEGYGMGVGYSE